METFKLNLRRNIQEIDISSFETNHVKIVFRFKALYKHEKINGKISLHIVISRNRPKIKKLTIYNLEFENSSSSTSYIFNPYKISSSMFDSSSNITHKHNNIYKSLRQFVKNTMVKKYNNVLKFIYFRLNNSSIRKMNIRGVAIKLSNY
jgi:hypothetical protein